MQSLDLGACRRVGDGALAALGGAAALAGLRALSLAGCGDVGDAGVAAVARLAALTHLDLRNCCKARAAQAFAPNHSCTSTPDFFITVRPSRNSQGQARKLLLSSPSVFDVAAMGSACCR